MSSFGNRRLENEDNVFDQNAWDDYEWTEEMEQEARAMLDISSAITMSEEERERFVTEAANFWDMFYNKHESKFFKNRKWLPREFVELIDGSLCSGPFLFGPPTFPGKESNFRVLEVGCGPGNSVAPILENRWRGENNTFVYACDFSEKAIALIKSSLHYDAQHCFPFQQDISKPNLTWPFPPECIDAICFSPKPFKIFTHAYGRAVFYSSETTVFTISPKSEPKRVVVLGVISIHEEMEHVPISFNKMR
ncbi:hypothetical protein Aperf_G00000018695 [Anoplocephala perfoliata]